ncbi:hypothetical protein NL676_035354 [Syzygium grande]|nr:hypothetical protein NL676_035354 [Syzygium grande]
MGVKLLDWYVKIAVFPALVGGSMDLFLIKNGFALVKEEGRALTWTVYYGDELNVLAGSILLGRKGRATYYNDICVGSIACRLEKKEGGAIRVYIMTLGVLAPYRGLGIGTRLLNHVLDLCTKQKISEIYTKQNISETYLHVQTNNEDAINFYKKFGFEITDTIQNYYTNISPPDCYVLTKFVSQPQPKK